MGVTHSAKVSIFSLEIFSVSNQNIFPPPVVAEKGVMMSLNVRLRPGWAGPTLSSFTLSSISSWMIEPDRHDNITTQPSATPNTGLIKLLTWHPLYYGQ